MRGYVVSVTGPVVDGRPPIVTYWFGPDHGWGTTSGTLSTSRPSRIARFTSRDHAERALRRVYGTMAAAQRRGYRVIATPSELR